MERQRESGIGLIAGAQDGDQEDGAPEPDPDLPPPSYTPIVFQRRSRGNMPMIHPRTGHGRTGFRGIAAEIRKRTRDGRDLIDFAERVLRDEQATVRDRWAALEWLADRGFGKAVQIIELQSSAPPLDLSRLTLEQLEQLDSLLGRAVIDVTSDES